MDDDRAGARYDRDLYSWAVEQAALLRAGKIAEADALNIAEEIDDVAMRQYDKLENAVRTILTNLLKVGHRSTSCSRSVRGSITVARNQISRLLRKNPGLEPRINEAVADAYDVARIMAAVDIDCDEDSFARACPYSWDEIVRRPIVVSPIN